MSPESTAADAATFLSSFLSAVCPDFTAQLTFTDSADASRTYRASRENGKRSINAVVKFGREANGDVTVSLLADGRKPLGFVMIFDAGADTSATVLAPSMTLEHEDGRKALLYLGRGDRTALDDLRTALEPVTGDRYKLGTELPLPFGEWTLSEDDEARLEAGEKPKVYDFGEVDQAFFGAADEAGEEDAPESRAEPEGEEALRARIAEAQTNTELTAVQRLALLFAEHGLTPIPVNGIVKNRKTKKLECRCQARKDWWAEMNGKIAEQCPSPGKHPTLADWQGSNSSRDPDAILHRFNPKYHRGAANVRDGLNVGIVTGPDSVVVLDIDGPEGMANLAKLEAEHGELPATVTVITGSGGRHYYFRPPPGIIIRNSASKIAAKIDIRGEHGFVVAPPSQHVSGGTYKWEEGRSPSQSPVAEMSGWLIGLAIEGGEKEAAGKPGKAKAAKASRSAASSRPGASSNVGGGWQGYLAEMGDQEGGRGFNGPIVEAMCSYFRLHGAESDASEFLEALGDTFAKADKSKGGRDKYRPDSSYIAEQLEKARQAIRDDPQKDFAIAVDADGWINFGDDHTRFCIARHEGREWFHTVEWSRDDKGNPVRGIGDPCCPQFRMLATAVDTHGGSATVTIGYETRHDGPRELTFAKAEIYDRAILLQRLASNLFPMDNESGVVALFKLLDFPVDTLLVERSGWHDGAFLHPSGTTIPAPSDSGARKKLRLRGGTPAGDWRGGTLDGWKASVALSFKNDARDREHFALGVMAGGAGIVAGFIGITGFPILNLHGLTSRGKSTALMLAASTSAAAIEAGAYQSLRKTDNGMEGILSARSGITIAFDEGKTSNADTLDNIVWMMAHGAGKTRGTVTGEARAGKEFCGFGMTANEIPLAQMLAAGKKSQPGGFHARVCDVDVSSVPELTGEEKDEFFAAVAGIKQHYGHAWEPIVRHLQTLGVEHVASEIDRLAKALAGPDADAFTARSARTLALVWFSGIVMQELGLIPACDVERVVRWAWGTRAVETTLDPFTRAMDTLLTNIATRRGLDILEWDSPAPGRLFREAAAFIYMNGVDELLLVPRDKLAELCGGHMSGSTIRDQMRARDMLVLSGKKDPKPRWSKLPDEQPLPHYRVKLATMQVFVGE